VLHQQLVPGEILILASVYILVFGCADESLKTKTGLADASVASERPV
jgi:hypothetical protein